MTPPEAIIEPDLPIIDPHHHLWDLRALLGSFPEPLHPFLETVGLSAHYTFDQFLADTSSGHRIIGTVFMECGAFYDASRSEAMKVVGEVEFVRGVAAQGASGLYGPYRPCAGIVGHADLRLGAEAGDVLDALEASSLPDSVTLAAPASRASAMPARGMRTQACSAPRSTIPKGSTAMPPSAKALPNWASAG